MVMPTHMSAPPTDVIDLTDLPSSDENEIVYPVIQEVLVSLDNDFPGVRYMQYHQRMLNAGFSRAGQLRDNRRIRTLLQNLSIPPLVLTQIFSRARHFQRRSEKQPADVPAIKKEDD